MRHRFESDRPSVPSAPSLKLWRSPRGELQVWGYGVEVVYREIFMLSRRQLLTIAGASIATLLAAKQGQGTTVLKPSRLYPGAKVGLISPASATFVREDVEIVSDAVRGLGLIPVLAPHLLSRYGYLAGKDRDRAADINEFFDARDIAALLPIQGGWGCARVLPYLDYELIAQHPKILVGFSDITALLLGIHARTGLITFHGPNGYSGWRSRQVESFRQVLFEGQRVSYQNGVAVEDSDRLMQVKNRIHTIYPGEARGKLIGGNLSVLSGIVGSPYFPNPDGAILFVEDIGENIYRIDRLLTHLALAGILERLNGFIFGQCTNCLPNGGYGSLTLEEVLDDQVKPLEIPAWSGAQIGHIETILTLPIGMEVAIDASRGTIQLLEPAVL